MTTAYLLASYDDRTPGLCVEAFRNIALATAILPISFVDKDRKTPAPLVTVTGEQADWFLRNSDDWCEAYDRRDAVAMATLRREAFEQYLKVVLSGCQARK